MSTSPVSVTVVGGVIVPVLVPLLLLLWLWLGRFGTRIHWCAAWTGTALALALLFQVSRWDVLAYAVRYLLPVVLLIGAASYLRHRPVRSGWRELRGWRFVGTVLSPLALLLALLVWMGWSMRAPMEAIDLEFPLGDGDYYVLHGGRPPLLNYHGAFDRSQRYALDIVRLDARGRRARGLYPRDLGVYSIFGDTVYSPIDGHVLAAEAALPDQQPGTRDEEHPAGNYLLIEQEGLVVALLHLKQESIQVRPGEQVRAGEPLALVGNSGSTSEPHLHIHAIRAPRAGVMSIEALHRDGQPVPMTFDGRFLVRNSRFP